MKTNQLPDRIAKEFSSRISLHVEAALKDMDITLLTHEQMMCLAIAAGVPYNAQLVNVGKVDFTMEFTIDQSAGVRFRVEPPLITVTWQENGMSKRCSWNKDDYHDKAWTEPGS